MTEERNSKKENEVSQEILDLADGLREFWFSDRGKEEINQFAQAAGIEFVRNGQKIGQAKLLFDVGKYLVLSRNEQYTEIGTDFRISPRSG